MELRDKHGLTEQEFLKNYRADKYPRPSMTADIVLLSPAKEGVEALLIRRGGHPFLGCWALPGGFVGPKESVDAAAARELEEETHVSVCRFGRWFSAAPPEEIRGPGPFQKPILL